MENKLDFTAINTAARERLSSILERLAFKVVIHDEAPTLKITKRGKAAGLYTLTPLVEGEFSIESCRGRNNFPKEFTELTWEGKRIKYYGLDHGEGFSNYAFFVGEPVNQPTKS